MDIDHGAGLGPLGIEGRWGELQRPVNTLVVAGPSVSIGVFGRSVPVVVLMLTQHVQGFGGLGEDAEGFGAPHIYWVGVTVPVEDVGDPVHAGFEPDRIAGRSP